MNYIDVVPALRLPRKLDAFTYSHDHELPIGSLVTVLFHGREVAGVVVARGPHPSIPKNKIRPIGRVLGAGIFSHEEIHAMDALALEYMTTRPRLWFYLLPQVPAKWSASAFSEVVASLPVRQAGLQLAKPSQPKELRLPNLITLMDTEEAIDVLVARIKKILSKKHSVQILVARKAQADWLREELAARLPTARMAAYYSGLSRTAAYGAWRSLLDGNDILITTRVGAMAPAPSLGLIVIWNEHDEEFKEYDREPFLDARRIAELRGAPRMIVSPAPRVETFYLLAPPLAPPSRGGEIPKKVPPLLEGRLGGVNIVDLNHDKPTPGSPFSTTLLEAIEKTVNTGKNAVILVPRRGEGSLKCLECGAISESPLFCSKCSGPRLISVGLATGRINSLLTKEYPDAKIVSVDRGRDLPSIEDGPHIIIGTTRLLTDFAPTLWSVRDRVGLLAALSGDSHMHAGDFRSEEKLFAALKALQALMKSETAFIIQTRSPHHRVFAALSSGEIRGLYQSWIEERTKWGYPPFVRLIALTRRSAYGTLEKSLAIDIERLRSRLSPEAHVTEPMPWPMPMRGKQMWTVLVKAPLETALPDLHTILPDWKVDVDPQRFFL